MSKFKVGDRVAVYGTNGNLESIRIKTNITACNSDGTLHTNSKDTYIQGMYGFDLTLVHPKQCRKLVKKERRRVWIPKTEDSFPSDNRGNKDLLGWLYEKPKAYALINFIEFLEVKNK